MWRTISARGPLVTSAVWRGERCLARIELVADDDRIERGLLGVH